MTNGFLMKENIVFIPTSFNFDGQVEELIPSITKASQLIKKLSSQGFITFSKSSDFYDTVISKIFGEDKIPEAGVLASLLYDGEMNCAKISDLDSHNIIRLVQLDQPILENNWIGIYGSLPNDIALTFKNRNVHSEENITDYGQSIIKNNNYSTDEYSNALKGLYTNLIFHQDYNHIIDIVGGHEKFADGIFEMFRFMNYYISNTNSVKEDISIIDSQIKFKTCEEGGGKKKRKILFHFNIDGKSTQYNCEFHCKIEYFDGQYKIGKYHNSNRMYFGIYKPQGRESKFLIAHIGGHL